eukprot:COSAG01_NODE_44978_length_413_cov_28.009554_1_plen_35_part_10
MVVRPHSYMHVNSPQLLLLKCATIVAHLPLANGIV